MSNRISEKKRRDLAPFMLTLQQAGLLPPGARSDMSDPDFIYMSNVVGLFEGKIKQPEQLVERASGFFMEELAYRRADLVSTGMTGTGTRELLRQVREAWAQLPAEDFAETLIKSALESSMAKDANEESVRARTLRVALTGETYPLDINKLIEVLGKERVLQRLDRAIQELTVVAQ